MTISLIVGAAIIGIVLFALFLSLVFRKVVPANMVHIVQSGKKTVSYGAGNEAGNSYYAWPSWIPKIGVSVSSFPLSNFNIRLSNYEGYDKGRLPFVVDIMAFFHIIDSNKAAKRVSSFPELNEQLTGVLQGAVRRILSTNALESIMQDRSTLSDEFTAEVSAQLTDGWGVETVRAIEFLDIRDTPNSTVIHNIMEKEQSRIDRESRVAVAENQRAAEEAEIESQRAVDVRQQEAQQAVGIRTAEKDREVGIANETSRQAVLTAQKDTTERQMEVARINEVRLAEIEKDKAVVEAQTYHETTTRNANADLEATKAYALGVVEKGKAEGQAETAKLLAPVTAQTTLAKEIGANESYQKYLVTIRQVEAQQSVGEAMAGAIGHADLKVIANGGNIGDGVTKLTDLLSTAGGLQLGGMLESFGQTEIGRALLNKAKAPKVPKSDNNDLDAINS